MSQEKQSESLFWLCVGEFVTLRTGTTNVDEDWRVAEVLSRARCLLGKRESRDILYSLMVARHLGPQRLWDEGLDEDQQYPNILNQASQSPQLEREDGMKLHIARCFLMEEANGRGMNQVSQRVADMALRGLAIR